jgi:hypothetical protein
MTGIHMTLLRIGRDLKGEQTGILQVMDGQTMLKAFATRENDRYLLYSSLRVGVYEMKHDKKRTGEQVRCLRPTDLRIERILIHRALNNDPNTLTGCIAPGTWGSLYDFTDSEKAMDELFEYLGGYQEGKTETLIVLSNASGVGLETQDTWWRTR